jgi:membrane fusion protein, multidrug efflux system
MRKFVVIGIVAAVLAAGGFALYRKNGSADPAGTAGAPGGGRQGQGGRGGARPPMPVEFGTASRAPVAEHVLVVGNLIGAATVQVVPKVNGRLQSVSVKLSDPVRRGQTIAKVEDSEIQEQVRQAEASYRVSQATIRQREADLQLARTNLERNRSLLERQLLPRQTYDDTDARYQAAVAQVDLAKAQFEQARARLDELKINLANTNILSPVDGFVGKRFLDAGAFVSPNAPVVSVVDIRSVRLVANLVEKDVKRVVQGTPGKVEVDAFPGETFNGKVSRVAPIFDPATRTAEMEIEVANPGFRLKPGMYARVQLTIDTRADALTVPRNAVVDLEGKRGVFVAVGGGRQGGGSQPGGGGERSAQPGPNAGGGAPAQPGAAPQQPAMTAKFIPVQTGIRDGERVEIVAGIEDGARVITTGAGALKDGDRIVAARGERGGRGPGQGERGRGERAAGARGDSQGSTR